MNNANFCKTFEEKVRSTIKEYKLAEQSDKIVVAVSGGKDSTTVLYLLKKLGYEVEGMIIDQLLGKYSKKNLGNIKKFSEDNNIRLHVVHMRDEHGSSVCYMKSILDSRGENLSSCTICGVIRRSILNKKVRHLKATKIATGHNLDDEVQTLFMNITSGNVKRCVRLGPKAGTIDNSKFIPRIKPLYMCLEDEVEKYSRINNFPVVYDPCPCAADSSRSYIKKMLDEMEEEYPKTKTSIMESFLNLRPILLDNQKPGELKECVFCGEPSSNKACRACNILGKLKTSARNEN